VGFTQTGVIYERGKRTYGREASIARLIKLALDGIFSFSYVPLRIASTLGIFFSLFSFIFIFIVILLRLFTPIGIVGWASTLSVILFVGGIQLLTLGIIGEYIARMYDEVKGRPTYIVAEKIGFKVSRLRKK
jgi:dolichol-phosphate mannosyltransferase